MNAEAKQVPEGYMRNAMGHLVPIEVVSEVDRLRNDTVITFIQEARELQDRITQFKSRTTDDFEAFVKFSAEKFGVEYGGEKGNITLSSFDGKYKVMFVIADLIEFDERLQIAKEMVDACLREWTDGARASLKAVAMQAFQVDKKGKINTGRVLEMTRWQIDDEQWKKAMEAVRASIMSVGTRSYFRFYERVGGSKKFRQIGLDFSSLWRSRHSSRTAVLVKV